MARSRDVFPAPEGPDKQTHSCGAMTRSTGPSSRMRNLSKRRPATAGVCPNAADFVEYMLQRL